MEDHKLEFNTLLVPIDFSEPSEAAYRGALSLAAGEAPLVILLHVIDADLVEFAAQHELAPEAEVVERMREVAEARLETLRNEAPTGVEVKSIVSAGIPFLEILKRSEELLVDAIVIGKVGARGEIEKLLFGSTAEKILRGSNRPVLVLPVDA